MSAEATTNTDASCAAALAFRCTACGHCCRALRVALTALDLKRLVAATGLEPAGLVSFLTPDEVDLSGEPDSVIELSEGRRLMVLRQQGGACVLLGADDRCAAYAARPRDCQAFPFDFTSDASHPGPSPRRHRLALLPLEGCDHASDAQSDFSTLLAVDRLRWDGLELYRALVASWNRRAWHRRRLGHRVGSQRDFLTFALTRTPLVELSSGAVASDERAKSVLVKDRY